MNPKVGRCKIKVYDVEDRSPAAEVSIMSKALSCCSPHG